MPTVDIADKTTLDTVNSKLGTISDSGGSTIFGKLNNLFPTFHHFHTSGTVSSENAGVPKTILEINGSGLVYSIFLSYTGISNGYAKIWIDSTVFEATLGLGSSPAVLVASNRSGLGFGDLTTVNNSIGTVSFNIPFKSQVKVEICGTAGESYTYNPNINYSIY